MIKNRIKQHIIQRDDGRRFIDSDKEWIVMEKEQRAIVGEAINDAYTEKWFSEEISLVTGLFHLMYDGQWKCTFASEECLRVLKCTHFQFMDTLQELPAFIAYKPSDKTVSSMLQKMAETKKPASFISIRKLSGEEIQYIKGTMVVSEYRDGVMYVIGQITDVSEEQERELHLEDLEATHRAGVEMSGRRFYRYIIKGRKAIIPSEAMKYLGVAGVVENMPEHEGVVKYIAPQSLDTWFGLFDAIDRGEQEGTADIFVQMGKSGETLRCCRVEFVGIFDEEGNPDSAILSYKDITGEFERERQQWLDRNGLLQVARMTFPETIAMNLTQKTYRFIQYLDTIILDIPKEGDLEHMLLTSCMNVMPEDREMFQEKFSIESQLQAIREGKEKIKGTYRQMGGDGMWHWIESIVIHQKNPYNDDVLTFAVSRNVDQQKEQEEMLRQALADSQGKLEEWVYYNGLSNQAFPGLIYINYEDGRPSPYTVGKLAEKLQCDPRELALSTSTKIPLEDRNVLYEAYEATGAGGEKDFDAEYRVELDTGGFAWVYNHAIPFTDKEGTAGYIHFMRDTTREYTLREQVRIHMEERLQENEETFRIVSQHSNRILYKYDLKSGTTQPWNQDSAEKDILSHLYDGSYTDDALMENPFVLPDSQDDVKAFFGAIYGGQESGEANVHVKLADGGTKWYHFKFSNIFEGGVPSTAMISIEDITEEYEEKLSIQQRADFDTMTGLLRKDVGEVRIKASLSSNRAKGGVLILLDLDDLKEINDNLGHQQGDAAIIGIADALKTHFRSDDVLIRAGGDEFMVFLPGAEHSMDSMEVSISELLRKISGIYVGEDKERNIHCSIGCVAALSGADSYETLFKRADLALYHVKRNGKNNYAFYVPEMEQADYEFRSKRLLSMEGGRKFEVAELQYLLRSIVTFYQLVLSVNISKNTYYMMEEVEDGVFSRLPAFGSLDGFVELAAKAIHPEDVGAYREELSRAGLMRVYEQGRDNVRQHFRFFVDGRYRWVECMAIFYVNDQGDVCDFTMLRWDDDWEQQRK